MSIQSLVVACGCCLSSLAIAADPAALPATFHDTFIAPNGDTFAMTKVSAEGIESVSYERNGVVYSREQLADYIHRNPIPRADASLINTARAMPPGTPLLVNVILRTQPREKIARTVWNRIAPELQALSDAAIKVQADFLPRGTLTPREEADFIDLQNSALGARPTPAQLAQIRALGERVEALQADARAEINRLSTQAVTGEQQALGALVNRLGGRVNDYLNTLSGGVVTIPAGALPALVNDPIVRRVFTFPEAIPELNIQKTSLGVTTVHNAGVDGGIWDPALLDSGVDQAHPAFAGKTFLEAPGVGTDDTESHGTAVCGILVSQDTTYTGMAPGCDTVLVGYFNRADVMADADWMVTVSTTDPENINISAGYGTANDVDYSDVDRFFDWIVDVERVPVSKSTGNNFDGTTTITHPAPAYNIIAVANMDDQDTITRSDDVITSSSSRGPTLSGRWKPDISAPGTNTATTSSAWESGADFTQTFGGTSAAAPHVGGTVMLLTDATSSDDPQRNKAIILNTADTWSHGSDSTSNNTSDDGSVGGDQWNKVYGRGYLDVASAYLHRANVFWNQTIDDGNTPAGPDYKFYVGTMTANEKATLVWNRHITFDYVSGNIDAPPSVPAEGFTDLDLFAFNSDTGVELDRGFSGSNNVEQISVAAAVPVVLKVDCFTANIDPDVGAETFALATQEGFLAATGPALATSAPASDVSPGQTFEFVVRVDNTGDVNAHNVTVNLSLPAGYTIVSGADPQNIGTVTPAVNGVATWILRAPCDTAQASISWTATSNSYLETFTDTGNRLVTPGTVALVSDTPVSDVDIEKTFAVAISSGEWHVTALNPGAINHNLAMDSSLCLPSPYQVSSGGAGVRDFIVTNGHLYGTGTHYARVQSGDSGLYWIESQVSFDLGVGGSTAQTFVANEVADIFETSVISGRHYRVSVDVTSGTVDPSIWVYRVDRTDGDRFNFNYRSITGGPGVDESVEVPCVGGSGTGFLAVAVINENGAIGNYTYRIVTTCTADFDDGSGLGRPDGGVSIEDLLYYLDLYGDGAACADVDDGSNSGTGDGGVSIEDLLYYLNRYDAGC